MGDSSATQQVQFQYSLDKRDLEFVIGEILWMDKKIQLYCVIVAVLLIATYPYAWTGQLADRLWGLLVLIAIFYPLLKVDNTVRAMHKTHVALNGISIAVTSDGIHATCGNGEQKYIPWPVIAKIKETKRCIFLESDYGELEIIIYKPRLDAEVLAAVRECLHEKVVAHP